MDSLAPYGQVYVCLCCGKRSLDLYGYHKINPGWDESCMLNSVLCYEDKLVISESEVNKYLIEKCPGIVTGLLDGGIVEDNNESNSEKEYITFRIGEESFSLKTKAGSR